MNVEKIISDASPLEAEEWKEKIVDAAMSAAKKFSEKNNIPIRSTTGFRTVMILFFNLLIYSFICIKWLIIDHCKLFLIKSFIKTFISH